MRGTVRPTLVDDVDEYTAVVGSPVRMSCDATGLPVPVITWYKDGVELKGGGRWSSDGGGLRIDRVVVDDSAVYECRATNDVGVASRHVTLTVHGRYSNTSQLFLDHI